MQDARRDPRATDRLIVKGTHRPHSGGDRGRFAPSPSGHLHAGSLVAALASRVWSTQWSIRIDDLDTPRVVAGAEDEIITTLERCGLDTKNTPILHQSQRLGAYHHALQLLCDAGLLFECSCSRRDIAEADIYPGHCRQRRTTRDQLDARLAQPASASHATALRVRLIGDVSFFDAIQGPQHARLEHDIGDVVVHRRDGVVAYALAAAVDDSNAIDDVVRGADLLAATAAQVALMHLIKADVPNYAHVPVLVDASGDKLGKQTRAPAIDNPLKALSVAWQVLGQAPCAALTPEQFVNEARAGFEPDKVPQRMHVMMPS